MREVEIKLPAGDPAAMRNRLTVLGARSRGGRLFEENWIYDDALGRNRERGMLLRLRTVGDRHIVTFKAPVTDEPVEGGYKTRLEHETRVDDADALRAILAGLGYRVSFRYQKYRETFEFGDLVVTLDETPIGSFVELEGPPASIDAFAAALGFAREDYVVKSYLQLFVESAGAAPTCEALFPDGPRR